MLIDKHTVEVNKCKIIGQIPLELLIGFCKTFKKITKNPVFHLTRKTKRSTKYYFHINSS